MRRREKKVDEIEEGREEEEQEETVNKTWQLHCAIN